MSETKELKLCQIDLEAYQIGVNDLNMFKEKLAEKREVIEKQFAEDNAQLIDNIRKLSEESDLEKSKFKELAFDEYTKTGEKKLVCGLGIRVGTTLIYEEDAALNWAEKSGIALKLDKRTFETFAKTQIKDLKKAKLDFVKTEDKVTVTFPKEIKIESEQFGGSQ